MMSEEKMKHKIMSELLDQLLEALPMEAPAAKTLKYTKKIRNCTEILLDNVKEFMTKDEENNEKVERIDNFVEEIYKLMEEFMKQENIEGV